MAHLDDDVAAYVDGQLTPEATDVAMRHVRACDRCAEAVEHQRMIKSRMRAVDGPEPPPALLASLSRLSSSPPPPRTRWSRFLRSSAWSAGAVLVGASLAVAVTAWVAGAEERTEFDAVAPPFAAYVADFTAGATTARDTITTAGLADLDEQGWPCRSRLAGDLERVDGRWRDGGSTVALTYSDGRSRLRLFEQTGSLERSVLEDFRRVVLGGHHVWVSGGVPRVVTWDADGVVYTIVTDVDDDRLARAVTDLPRPREIRGPDDRLRDGLARMTAWVPAA